MTTLRTLTDEEFLALAEVGQDDLTSTALELEFMRRFRALISAANVGADFLSMLEDCQMDAEKAEDYLTVIRGAELLDAKQLAADLALAKEFRMLADEAGDLAVGGDGSLGNLPDYGQDLVCEIFSKTGGWCHVTAPPSAPPTASPACR